MFLQIILYNLKFKNGENKMNDKKQTPIETKDETKKAIPQWQEKIKNSIPDTELFNSISSWE